MSNSLGPHGLQYIRLSCTSPSPRAYSNSCPSSQWLHPTISSSVVPFSSRLQSFPASGSFLMSCFSHQVAEVLELQHQSFQWIFRSDFLLDWLVWSPCSPRREVYNQKRSIAKETSGRETLWGERTWLRQWKEGMDQRAGPEVESARVGSLVVWNRRNRTVSGRKAVHQVRWGRW